MVASATKLCCQLCHTTEPQHREERVWLPPKHSDDHPKGANCTVRSRWGSKAMLVQTGARQKDRTATRMQSGKAQTQNFGPRNAGRPSKMELSSIKLAFIGDPCMTKVGSCKRACPGGTLPLPFSPSPPD